MTHFFLAQTIKLSRFGNINNVNLIPPANSDLPSKEDSLNHKIYAEKIAEMIVSEKTETPLSIAVYASWGQGKSTFINLIKNKIKEENKEIIIVDYDAWKYDDQNQIWAGLLQELIREYQEKKGFSNTSLNFIKEKYRKNVDKKLKDCITSLKDFKKECYYFFKIIKKTDIGRIFALLTGIFGVVLISTNLNLFLLILISTIVLFVLIICILPLIIRSIPIFQLFIDFSSLSGLIKPVKKQFIDYFKIPDYTTNLGFKNEIQENLKIILDDWLEIGEDEKRKKRLIIFVDNLDRCSQDKIVQVLDALKLFLDEENVIILYGIDQEIVCSAVCEKYKSFYESSNGKKCKRQYALDYIEKMIQIPFVLPIDNDYHELINKLIGEIIISSSDTSRNDSTSSVTDVNASWSNLTSSEADMSASWGNLTNSEADMGTSRSNLTSNDTDTASDTQFFKFKKSHIEKIQEVCSELKESPRYVKRFINICRLILSLNMKYNLDENLLIAWLGFCKQWHYLAFRVLDKLEDNKDSDTYKNNILEENIEAVKYYNYFKLCKIAEFSPQDKAKIRGLLKCFTPEMEICRKCGEDCHFSK
ncbi:MAG: P-loop NTPase fold protein [bacterium]